MSLSYQGFLKRFNHLFFHQNVTKSAVFLQHFPKQKKKPLISQGFFFHGA
jgi:hypothetical protein